MIARASVDPGLVMALLHRVLIGTAVFFMALLIGVQVTRAAGSFVRAGFPVHSGRRRRIGRLPGRDGRRITFISFHGDRTKNPAARCSRPLSPLEARTD